MDIDWSTPEEIDPYQLERLFYFERYAWLSLSPDMCAVISIDGQFEDVNTQWERVTGIARDDMQGAYLMEHIHFDDRERALADMQKLITSDIGFTSFSFRFLCSKKKTLKLNWNVIYSPDHNAYFCTVTAPDKGGGSESLAYRDVLTGLKNRLAFERDMPGVLDHASDTESKCAVMFIDLDGFKEVNDTYGHKAGDTVLVRAAKRMIDVAGNNGTIYRLGGDEFVVLLPGVPDQNTVAAVAGQMVARLRNHYVIEGTRVHTGASIGIATSPADGETYETILDAADKAMYEVKHGGKNNFAFYECHSGNVCKDDTITND